MNAQSLRATEPVPLELTKPVYLSHSSSTLYETCPNKYRMRYEARLASTITSVNLGYGSAFDEAVSAFIVAHALGHADKVDPIAIFERSFETFASFNTVGYSTVFDGKKTCIDSGTKLTEQFVESWLRLGYTAILDVDGKPVVQRELKVRLPHNVIYTAIIDVVLLTPDLEVVVSDVKSAAQESGGAFHINAGQLTGQQLVVDAHSEALGINAIDGLCFYQGIKKPIPKRKGIGPHVIDPAILPARTPEQLKEYVDSRLWIAEDIRRKRFPKRPLDAYSTPCSELCEYANLCTRGDMHGLQVRQSRSKKAATALASPF